ncbi:MAG: sigma-70 family RNA polymerase sigma factor [Opitutaceae bacterium]|nr:sigma-70 family RNA polymerase sigma factor [Opitutaceae bacterium]
MRRVQAADEVALSRLMERWELPVKRLLARIVLNATEAEELAQETFVRVWQQRDKFRDGAALRPWIFAIAANLARNRLRWWKRRPVVALDDWTEVPTHDGGADDSGTRRLERAERVKAVRDAIADLPGELRESLVLFEYEQMSYAEIAETVGASPKAIESRIARARGKLGLALKSWAKNHGDYDA